MRVLLFRSLVGALLFGTLAAFGPENHPEFMAEDYSPAPWTDKPIVTESRNFSFAIIGDRAGGTRLGVFAQAVDKMNLLRPAFVMSVGDLKGGEVPGFEDADSDTERHLLQWDYFDAVANRLDMTFFYVGGNADLVVTDTPEGGTPDMLKKEIWARRYGPTYYSFAFNNVLFIALDTDDPPLEHTKGNIGPAQRAWLAKTLADHEDVRWTFLFFHVPLWRETPQQWQEIDTILGRRQMTVFSGHYHRYAKETVLGRQHYSLASTGGFKGGGNPEPDRFDHIMWVTVTDEGPIIANLPLSGIWSDDPVAAGEKE